MRAAARVDLGALARARGVRLISLDKVDSTNDEAKRLVATGERGPLWIVAQQQTQGRGRLGRAWVSAAGNLHSSYIIADFGGPAISPQLGFVAGVAAIEALRRVVGDAAHFALKWPNDLLFDGGKLGGILLEAVATPSADPQPQMAAIIGIGVNCAFAPADLPYETRSLAALGPGAPTAAHLFAHLSDTLVETLDLWNSGAGFAAVRARWLEVAAGLGSPIRVALSRGETVEGRFETIDPTGRLVLATLEGARTIEAGDVFLAPPAQHALERSGKQ